jgi:hypothetical protein
MMMITPHTLVEAGLYPDEPSHSNFKAFFIGHGGRISHGSWGGDGMKNIRSNSDVCETLCATSI